MRLKVDKKNDALYFRLDESPIIDSQEIQPGIILDYDSNNQVVGIEILGISKRTDQENFKSILFETVWLKTLCKFTPSLTLPAVNDIF